MLLGRLDFKVGTFYRFLITAIIALPVMLFFAKAPVVMPSTVQFGFLALIAVSTGMVALLIYYRGLAKTSVHVTTILELTFPFMAIFLDYMVKDTVLTLSQWVAAVVLVFSIYQITKLRENLHVV
jgi:drug/metabolite transporter (DMT)-like permease